MTNVCSAKLKFGSHGPTDAARRRSITKADQNAASTSRKGEKKNEKCLWFTKPITVHCIFCTDSRSQAQPPQKRDPRVSGGRGEGENPYSCGWISYQLTNRLLRTVPWFIERFHANNMMEPWFDDPQLDRGAYKRVGSGIRRKEAAGGEEEEEHPNSWEME